MTWSEKDLEKLPRKQGFRLRGLEMTRLETFIDAAFAFAITILVISINDLPKNYQELVRALKDIPAFAGSFAIIMSVWVSHRKWSRRYGLEDMISILISLVLIFIMLVYVYPLKLLFSVLFAWISGGWLPSQFSLHKMGLPRKNRFYELFLYKLQKELKHLIRWDLQSPSRELRIHPMPEKQPTRPFS